MKAGEESGGGTPPDALGTGQQQPVAELPEASSQGIDVGVLIIFAVILGAVIFSNIWLRRRAQRGD